MMARLFFYTNAYRTRKKFINFAITKMLYIT